MQEKEVWRTVSMREMQTILPRMQGEEPCKADQYRVGNVGSGAPVVPISPKLATYLWGKSTLLHLTVGRAGFT